ncbi:MAG TPA: class I SAM-dependent methyltransferase [Acidimicrobiia bacterium]|nr:class I SAM-dependent methyltransferase [Acidimicrobiia bacterium]
MSVHQVAQQGFGAGAERYQRSRPSYPPDAVAWLVDSLRIGPDATVLDVAAGTGIFTRLLAPRGARLIAVEPVEAMRRLFTAAVPGVPVVSGTAEAMPFAAGTADAITVAQAFHWFDVQQAPRELHRVLRPGGRLGLLWNTRDRSVDWVDALWSIIDRYERDAPWGGQSKWGERAFVETPWFGELHGATFRHEQVLTPKLVVERMLGVSHVAVLQPAEQQEVAGEVRAVLAAHPATRNKATVAIPYRVDAYWRERQ